MEGGLRSVTNIDWKVDENTLLSFQRESFAPLKSIEEVIVCNSTTMTGKVSKYISAILSEQAINEKRVSPRTQVKESMALGLSYAIF